MTFDDAVKKHQGEWGEDGLFRLVGPDGYIWIAAKKVDGKVEVTRDGDRFGLAVAVVAKEPPVVVESVVKKQRKVEQPKVSAPPKNLDDLEF